MTNFDKISIMAAGDNERAFRNLITQKLGNILHGKRVWRSEGGRQDRVEISVDQTILTPNYRLLIEIDSGNYAKLIVGQYILINGLNNDDLGQIKDVFVVVHYNGRDQKPYNPDRTERNLRFTNENILHGSGIPFVVFNLSTFEDFISDLDSVEALDKRISEFIEL